ncbi:AsnC family protein [Escherichia coli]|uniref:AsnC family protein n=1 Tax=Escherichia coli TaxID=562 RepID=UPI000BE3960B|nr:AsnC family protein [Escherichia coli]EFA9621663.1 AsnC family protein [Escherichia coli]EJL2514053.1 AsnC family protein [Escherichia coli]MCV2016958.1 AsnC family protein [Escherichia coli]HBB0008947.1 AsnC family protein [Escherichia coli]
MMKLQPMGRKGRAPAHVRAWTPEEDALLIALYPSTPVKDIAVRVKRSYWGVYNRIVLLRGTYPESLKCKRPRFKPDEDKFIRKNARTMTSRQMGEYLGRHHDSIRCRARVTGVSLKKCGELLPFTRIPDDDVRLIRELRDAESPRRITFREIGEKFELSESTVNFIYHHRRTAGDAVLRELTP